MQEDKRYQYINHLLYASPVKRGKDVEIIEDITPIFDIDVSIKVDEKIKSVYLADTKKPLEFTEKDGVISYTVPKIDCHQMVILEY